ncbi:MAG: hypothetical protein ACFBSC_21600 [Microcoleaceae cyanobacterium]
MNAFFHLQPIAHFSLSLRQGKRWFAAIAASAASVSLISVPVAAFPSFDLLTEKDYARCTTELQSVGLSADLIAQGCAAVIRPQNLSACVTRMNREVAIDPQDALVSCVGVRRPEELATCVVNITQSTGEANPLNVMNSCRRSLLPERYSFCVLGISQEGGIGVDQALETCLNPPEQFLDLGLEN